MTWTRHDYEDIPGIYVFDGRHAHGAYPLNKLLFSFCEETNLNEFDRDPADYCDKYGVGGEHKALESPATRSGSSVSRTPRSCAAPAPKASKPSCGW